MRDWIDRPIKGISCAIWDSHTMPLLSRMGVASPEGLPRKEQLDRLAEKIASLGFNTAFFHCFGKEGGLREEDDIGAVFAALRTFGVAPVAYGPGLIMHENPGYRAAVDRVGEVRDPKIICPNDEVYVSRLVEDSIKLPGLGAAAVMHDFLRYEKFDRFDPPVEYCFCDVCLEKFQRDSGIEIPAKYGTTAEKGDYVLGLKEPLDYRIFIRWRAQQITDIARRYTQAIHADYPDCVVGNFAYAGPHNQNMLRVGHDLEGLAEAFSEGGQYPAILGPMGYGVSPYDLLFRSRYYRKCTKDLARSVWALTPLMNSLDELALQMKMVRLGGGDGFFLWALRFLYQEHFERWEGFRKAMEEMDYISSC